MPISIIELHLINKVFDMIAILMLVMGPIINNKMWNYDNIFVSLLDHSL